jgi:hypothetical protein
MLAISPWSEEKSNQILDMNYIPGYAGVQILFIYVTPRECRIWIPCGRK